MLKFLFPCLVFILSLILALPSNASTRASSTLSATLMASQDIKVVQSFEPSSIDMSGYLSSPSQSNFQLITNNKDGVVVTFEAISNSTMGEKSSMHGNDGSSSGKVILTNSKQVPSSQSVENALSAGANSINNPNAIAYKIVFENKNGLNPIFQDNIATTTISGLSDFEIKIDNGDETQGTFGANDISGVYNTTIVCTVSTP